VQLAEPLDGRELPTLEGFEVSQTGSDWFTYKTTSASDLNPILLQNLVGAGFQVMKIEEVLRSLESVYLQAVNYVPVEDEVNVD
jgi:endonuclease V-like protein UPF0215 family